MVVIQFVIFVVVVHLKSLTVRLMPLSSYQIPKAIMGLLVFGLAIYIYVIVYSLLSSFRVISIRNHHHHQHHRVSVSHHIHAFA